MGTTRCGVAQGGGGASNCSPVMQRKSKGSFQRKLSRGWLLLGSGSGSDITGLESENLFRVIISQAPSPTHSHGSGKTQMTEMTHAPSHSTGDAEEEWDEEGNESGEESSLEGSERSRHSHKSRKSRKNVKPSPALAALPESRLNSAAARGGSPGRPGTGQASSRGGVRMTLRSAGGTDTAGGLGSADGPGGDASGVGLGGAGGSAAGRGRLNAPGSVAPPGDPPWTTDPSISREERTQRQWAERLTTMIEREPSLLGPNPDSFDTVREMSPRVVLPLLPPVLRACQQHAVDSQHCSPLVNSPDHLLPSLVPRIAPPTPYP